MLVVIVPELFQLARQVDDVPEQYVIEILPPDRAPISRSIKGSDNGTWGIDLISLYLIHMNLPPHRMGS